MSNRLTEPSFWILSSLAGGSRHGYAIVQEVASLSSGAIELKAPTLYATLERLEHSGLIVTAGEEVVNGRARRYFSLTDAGRSALETEAAHLVERARVARERLTVRPALTRAVLA